LWRNALAIDRKYRFDCHGRQMQCLNVFIHDTVPPIALMRNYFFMDGDAKAVPGSSSAMARAFRLIPMRMPRQPCRRRA
jgi:hypothetical protein